VSTHHGEAADRALADAAVNALLARLALRGHPAAPGPREADAMRWSAHALAPGFAAMAASARRTTSVGAGLREELGAIGRSTERAAERAGAAHRGSLWVLGLLVAGEAHEPGAALARAKEIAAHPDRGAPRRPSRGASMSAQYGAAGARGEARAGFPHVRRGVAALRRARTAPGTSPHGTQLEALLTIMTTLQDTELLHTAGPLGLRHVQAGARAVLDAGGALTSPGRAALESFDLDLRERGWAPRGSATLLTGALFVEALRS
jgi:triphosphoribosyl-dephospho-CoA synthase